MRIICVEEHLADRGLAAATEAAVHEGAPYGTGLWSAFREDPDLEPRDRPRLAAPQTALRLASEPVEQRLAAMDRAAIDVQVLSYANAAQFARPRSSGLPTTA